MPGGRTEPSTNLRLRLALTPAMPSPTSHWRVSIGNLGRAPIRSGKWKPTSGSIRSPKPNLLACRHRLIPDPLTANALATVPREKNGTAAPEFALGRGRLQGRTATSQRSELDTSCQLDVARVADGAVPLPEDTATGVHRGIEGIAGAVALVHEIVIVEEVEEVRRELEVHPFGNLRVLGERYIPILVGLAIDSGNTFSVSGVTPRGEVAFKGQRIQVLRAILRRVKAVPSVYKWPLTREDSRDAGLAEITQTGRWATARGEGHGNAPLIAVERADLPPTDQRIQRPPGTEEPLTASERKIVNRGDLPCDRHVAWRQGILALGVKG